MKKIFISFIITILMISCATYRQIVEVPVETVKVEYKYNTIVDSIYIKDSIDRWQKGDTIFVYKERVKYKYISKVDTIIKIDSIPKIVKLETVREVKVNHIRWYQKILMWIGGISSISVILMLYLKLKR